MEAAKKRVIERGTHYERLFPAATGVIKTIRENAGVGDTLSFIRKIVPATLDQTKEIAAALKGRTVYDSCRNIWQFVYTHIAYKKDRDGYEQVRSPRRSWRDRAQGVDCDCYTTFISSILSNLRIPHVLRVTKYYKPHFQHIYPVVQYHSRSIILDCVTDYFNYEVPFSEKKDVKMNLEYLDGLDATAYSSAEDQVFAGSDEFGELGLFGRRRKKRQAAAEVDPMANPDAVPGTGKKKKKGFFRKLLNVTNKLNPLTLALRNGLLAAMKLNIAKLGSRLRWSYLSPNAAKAKGIDMTRYAQLVRTRQKLEDIFSNAGGNPANMRKAIIKGKGNRDHAVNGLLGLGAVQMDDGVMSMNIHTPLPQLLGEIYYDENVRGMEGFEGFGELGEPITLATVGAAAGVIAAIASSLRKIGDIFKGKKTEGSEDFSEEAAATAANEVTAVKNAVPAATANNPVANAAAATFSAEDNTPAAAIAHTSSTAVATNDTGTDTGDSNTPAGKKNFWESNRKWIIPAGIGVAVIGIAVKMAGHNGSSAPPPPTRSRSLAGISKRRYTKRKHPKKGSHHHHRKAPVALV